MSQTLALLLDAYRDLNSRRMFWIVLILSTLVAASFGAVGLSPKGFEIFTWKIPSNFLNTSYISPADFYNFILLTYGIGFWLTWAATILALISTGGLFPDFIATGAVDLYLSKPIGRLRLFLTKYLFGLLFVAVQIVCFCAASFLVIGLRGGVWEPGLFLAVPIVVLFFSYLFCVCVLLGVWTRSSIAAVLLTLLFWFGVFGLHYTEVFLLAAKISNENRAARLDRQISATETLLADAHRVAATRPTTRNSRYVDTYASQLQRQESDRAGVTTTFAGIHQFFYAAMIVLPKTKDTLDLLDRKLIDSAHLQRVAQTRQDSSDNNSSDFASNPEDTRALQAELGKRTAAWIVGTSVAFELAVLALAAWIFCRRDY